MTPRQLWSRVALALGGSLILAFAFAAWNARQWAGGGRNACEETCLGSCRKAQECGFHSGECGKGCRAACRNVADPPGFDRERCQARLRSLTCEEAEKIARGDREPIADACAAASP